MFHKNKKLLLLTSLITLLPIPVGMALMDRFPESMAIHFGMNGQPDGFASPLTAVLLMPLILLSGQWFLVLVSRLDKSNHDRNPEGGAVGQSHPLQPVQLQHVCAVSGYEIFSHRLDAAVYGHPLRRHRKLYAQDPDECHHRHQDPLHLLQ